MLSTRKLLTAAAVGTLVSLAAVVAGTSAASAHVVCNRAGDCWSTHSRYHYPRNLGVRIYSDRYQREEYRQRHWRNKQRNWRDDHHERDRGYYRDGLWVTF